MLVCNDHFWRARVRLGSGRCTAPRHAGSAGSCRVDGVVYLSGLRPISIPGTKSSITPGDIFIFLTALFYGPPAATLVAATDALAGAHRASQRWTSRLGSPAVVSISVFASGSLFQWLLVNWQQNQSFTPNTTLFAALLIFSSSQIFIIHSLLMARSLCAQEADSPSSALVGQLFMGQFDLYGQRFGSRDNLSRDHQLWYERRCLAAGPLVAVIFATCHLYSKRADDRAKASEKHQPTPPGHSRSACDCHRRQG